MKIRTSSIDTNNYFTYTLSNGLKIIAISDLKADKAGCALSVSIGSYDEPKEIQGLAHFLEHMLFMGTKDYPRENEYMDFLNQHNGSSNAYTSNENTVYFFDIGLNYFYEALRIFSSFFKNPLFLKESVDREISAVHSEFLNGKCNDSWRIFRMIQLSCKEDLPESQFNVGNNKTLRIEKINEIVKKFWEEKYSSEKMCVVLYSNEGEEKFKKYCELFEGIYTSRSNDDNGGGNDDNGGGNDDNGRSKDVNGGGKDDKVDQDITDIDRNKINQDINDINKNVKNLSLNYTKPLVKTDIPLKDLTLSKSIFKKDFLNRIINVEPIKDQKTLIISVVVPSEFKFIGINPYSYIEHFFTREDGKGLVGRIKDKGLGFYADFDLNSYSKYSLLQISIGLTSKGEKDLNLLLKIVEDYFSNFEFIEEEYQKIKDLKELQFFYKEMDDPIDCVESMAEIMQYVPIENVFDYSYILHKYDQKVLEEIVSCIGNRSKWVIFYLKKDLEFDSEDELYGIKYKVN